LLITFEVSQSWRARKTGTTFLIVPKNALWAV
jgi:hypothetical protein